MFDKKVVLKNFKKFIGKYLCWDVLFLLKLQFSGLYEKRDSDEGFFSFILWNVYKFFPLSNCHYLWKELKIAYIVENPANTTLQ